LLRSSRSRLTRHQIPRFPGETLFDRLARTVCEAECLPRKELYEAWEVAKRVRRRFRGGTVVDIAGGHGLVAFSMLLLDNSSPNAVVVDRRRPASFDRLEAALTEAWPRLAGRITYEEMNLEEYEAPKDALLLGVHACGPLTDRVIDMAIQGRTRVAVLPCCHSLDRCDTGALEGWLTGPVAIDATRVARLRAEGFRVRTGTIPADITPENRLLIAEPEKQPHGSTAAG